MSTNTGMDPVDQRDEGLSALSRALHISFRLLIVALVAAVFVFLWRSFFVVEQYEVGLVLRFGQLLGEDDEYIRRDGLHMTFPHPIDEKITVPAAGRVQTIESRAMWYRDDPTTVQRDIPPTLKPGIDGYSLTGDLAIIHSQWSLRYTIDQPLEYAFAFADRTATYEVSRLFLRKLLNSAITQASASMPVDDVWANRQMFADEVRRIVQADLEVLKLGINVESVQPQPVRVEPPRQVEAAFQSVTGANTASAQVINQANSYRAQIVSQAESEANRLVTAATTYKEEKIGKASADAAYFEVLYEQYKTYPHMRASMQQAVLQRILQRPKHKFLMQGDEDELRLLLNPPPTKTPRATTP